MNLNKPIALKLDQKIQEILVPPPMNNFTSASIHNNNYQNKMTQIPFGNTMSPTINIDDIDINNTLPLELSTVQQFYYGCNILITGGTGFLGKSKHLFSIYYSLKCQFENRQYEKSDLDSR
jgi:hypothetical protein